MAELLWACELFATVADFTGDCECDCAINFEDPEHIALLEASLIAASDTLTVLSAHELRGICSQTVQVCLDRCSCRSRCTCHWDEIALPGIPVVSVDEVGFDGYVFDANDFVIVDDRAVAWASGSDQSWPVGKIIEIDYHFGHPIDEISRRAALGLACVAMRACLADGRTLGEGVEQVSREGITIARRTVSSTANTSERVASDNPWLAKFLTLYNPNRANFAPFAYSPDLDEVHVIRAI